MRYYNIILTDQNDKLIQTASSVPGSNATYTSFANNRTLGGALQIELDIPLRAYGTPMKGSMVRVWGITQAEISKSTQWNPKFNVDGSTSFTNIQVFGGMKPGLPLATAASAANQAGLLVGGSILKAWGNWVGNSMSVDMIIAPSLGSNAKPANIVVDWTAGTKMSDALNVTLSNAFKQYGKPSININPNLVLGYNEQSKYPSIEPFAKFVLQKSQSILGGNYPGVNIWFNNGTLLVTDQTTPTPAKKILFQDMIGQPTWIENNNMQFKCMMRADIAIGDTIQMPAAIVTTTSAASTSQLNLKSTFEGTFYISEMRHVGNFRQADAESWVTTFNGAPQNVVSA